MILTTPEDSQVLMTAAIVEALQSQRPFAEGLLSLVACGERQDSPASLPELAQALLLLTKARAGCS